MRAEILSVGAELLAGDITDTNATFLARELRSLGIELRHVTQVGDRLEEIVATLRRATDNAELVICTGGIGPTPDDLTREAIAALLSEEMVIVPELEERLRAWFAGRGRDMPRRNLKQAALIPSAEALANRSGTAPGWWVRAGERKTILAMPGVPHEMKMIWREEVYPRLLGASGSYIVSETLKTQGLGESTVAEMLGDLLAREQPEMGTYAKADGVHIVATASGPDPAEAAAVVQAAAAQVRAILGPAIWGAGDDTMATVVADHLERAGMTVATNETASAGRLAAELLATGSAAYRGGGIAGGAAPEAAFLLRVGAMTTEDANGRTMAGTTVELLRADVVVDRSDARIASAAALPERAAIAALDLLRRHLLAMA